MENIINSPNVAFLYRTDVDKRRRANVIPARLTRVLRRGGGPNAFVGNTVEPRLTVGLGALTVKRATDIYSNTCIRIIYYFFNNYNTRTDIIR